MSLRKAFAQLVNSPLLWGAALTGAFYWLIAEGVVQHELVMRYFTSHPVEYVAAAMFFVGLAALVLKAVDTAEQFGQMRRSRWMPEHDSSTGLPDCAQLREQMAEKIPQAERGRMWDRLMGGIRHVERSGTADDLDGQLRYLAEQEEERLHTSYGLVRLIIWAIPVLGFLGTVDGLTGALGKLSVEDLESALLDIVTPLGAAFHTTFQALALSIVAMFAQFFVFRWESKLLGRVDERGRAELESVFPTSSTGGDRQVAAMRRLADASIQATHQTVQRQAEIWAQTIDAAQARWSRMAEAGSEQLVGGLKVAMAEHARHLAVAEQQASQQLSERTREIHHGLERSTAAAVALQQQITAQGATMKQVVDATGRVISLEDALNRNLGAVAGSHKFEETLLSLSAAIHLLNGRLGSTATPAESVDLVQRRRESNAA